MHLISKLCQQTNWERICMNGCYQCENAFYVMELVCCVQCSFYHHYQLVHAHSRVKASVMSIY